jgi:pimeloyl-ACP methyl ester carboxylesterase
MSKRTDEHAKIHMRTQEAMSHYSTQGRQIIVSGAGHHIQLEQPEVVIDAIGQVLLAVRNSSDKGDRHK